MAMDAALQLLNQKERSTIDLKEEDTIQETPMGRLKPERKEGGSLYV
ncbi:MAG TPA: hypothetical protein VGB32_13465 [Candidatus Bathyarchaeia archaeon]